MDICLRLFACSGFPGIHQLNNKDHNHQPGKYGKRIGERAIQYVCKVKTKNGQGQRKLDYRIGLFEIFSHIALWFLNKIKYCFFERADVLLKVIDNV